MSNFAEIDKNNKVVRVIVAEQDFINTLPGRWVQTSYNTIKGRHLHGKRPLRKNFAGIGYTYDETLDAFIPPKRFASWVLDTKTCTWKPPIDPPQTTIPYRWDEWEQTWKEINEVKNV